MAEAGVETMGEASPIGAAPRDRLALDSFRTFDPNANGSGSTKVVGFDSRDVRSRPFNLLRTRLAKETEAQHSRLVGLTSPTPGSGKSFLSLNLAASLARLGEMEVYLVDLDLRRASVAEQLGISGGPGIDDVLVGRAQLEDVGLRVGELPLVIFPTNRVENSSAEYLSGKPFSQMIRQLRAQAGAGLVLFDLPPVFASDDAMIIIESLDGYVMIVDSGKTGKRQVTDSMEMLKPSPCIGSILNRYKGGLLDSYGYGSKAYANYYDN